MTLTCVQAKMGVFVWRACVHTLAYVRARVLYVCLRSWVRCAKERGVQYERAARANRAMDSAPA